MSVNKNPLVIPKKLQESVRSKLSNVDVTGLEIELRRTIEGEVRFDTGSKALYATDSSNYRQVPIGVVIPKSREDAIQTVATCRKFSTPLLSRGGGTSLAGQCCNIAVVMDWTKYLHNIVELNPREKCRIFPGEYRATTWTSCCPAKMAASMWPAR